MIVLVLWSKKRNTPADEEVFRLGHGDVQFLDGQQ
ncbi:conserved protein of unknown function [Streptomyces sp. KY75]|nr:conserved protein of unknown function [Streptomyces sp. KY70]CAD5994221.1 conserved protein of unknown function [Streptomyces sp. KY75]